MNLKRKNRKIAKKVLIIDPQNMDFSQKEI